jgi:hypothetical protein
MTLNVALKNIIYMSEEIEKDTVGREYDPERISFLLTYISSFKYLIEPQGHSPFGGDIDKLHRDMDENMMKGFSDNNAMTIVIQQQATDNVEDKTTEPIISSSPALHKARIPPWVVVNNNNSNNSNQSESPSTPSSLHSSSSAIPSSLPVPISTAACSTTANATLVSGAEHQPASVSPTTTSAISSHVHGSSPSLPSIAIPPTSRIHVHRQDGSLHKRVPIRPVSPSNSPLVSPRDMTTENL